MEGRVAISAAWSDMQNVLSERNDRVDDNLDSVMADAMNRLSFEDREKVALELHGVLNSHHEMDETPEFVAQKLHELEDELLLLKANTKHPTAALEIAEHVSRAYVEDPKFRIQFLRSDKFNAKLAAQRMAYFFEYKFELFGGGKLCKDIAYEDLDDYDIHALEKGFLQVLPVRDAAGRPVLVFFGDKQDYKSGTDIAATFGRISFFLFTALEEGETGSKCGISCVFYNVGDITVERLYPETPPVFMRLKKSFPARVVSFHFCFSSPLFRLVVQNFLLLFGKAIDAATKAHQGSQQEVMYTLMTYGIPTDSFPVNCNNEIKRANHMEMLKMIQGQEQHIQKHGNRDNCVLMPFLYDVLLGKGEPTQNSPGNIRLKATVDELLDLHESLSREDKTELVNQVLQTVKESGGRFLSKETGVWVVVPDTEARSRITTMFRNRKKFRKKKRKQQEKQAAASTTRSNAPRANSGVDDKSEQKSKRAKV